MKKEVVFIKKDVLDYTFDILPKDIQDRLYNPKNKSTEKSKFYKDIIDILEEVASNNFKIKRGREDKEKAISYLNILFNTVEDIDLVESTESKGWTLLFKDVDNIPPVDTIIEILDFTHNEETIAFYLKSIDQFKKILEAQEDLKNKEEELKKREEAVKKEKKRLEKLLKNQIGGKHTKVSIHTMSQFFADNKQLSVFSDEKIDVFKDATGLNLTNRPTNYGIVLNQSQKRVFEGILKAFTNTNYKGDEEVTKQKALEGVYTLNKETAEELLLKSNAPYRNIDKIPVVKLTQAQIIDFSGYDLTAQKQSDKQHVIEALAFLATNQFCFYWVRLKTENGKPVKDKSGDYVKEEVMEVGTLLRIKTVRDGTGILQYYEIQPSAPLLDQVNNYFLLVPNNWRDEVKQLTGKRASSYTYELLLWLRLQYEQIRRYNNVGGKNRKPKTFKISKSWEEVAIALKMPESVYKGKRKRASKIIQEAYSVAIKLGYLVRVENNGAIDILYLNERYYPKPGELV